MKRTCDIFILLIAIAVLSACDEKPARTSVTLDRSEKNKLFYIDFDGIYRNSEVWINGYYLGKRANGYSSFRHELTPFLIYGEEKNILAVRVDNSLQPNSRWYTGSGIYRNVWLVSTSRLHIGQWGFYITTPERSEERRVGKECRSR